MTHMEHDRSTKAKTTSKTRRRGTEAGGRGRDARDVEDGERHQEPPPPPSAYDPPEDLDGLRAARVKSMATPPTARNRIKGEHAPERPSHRRSASVADPKAPRRSNSIFGRSLVSQASKASKPRSKEKSQRRAQSDDETQYVYRPRSGVDRRDFQKEYDKAEREERRRRKAEKENKPTKQGTPPVERRKTDPGSKSKATDEAKRPALRKSTTTITNAHNSDPPAPEPARSEAGKAKSAATPARKQSLLGSIIFGPSTPPVPEKKVSCLTCGDDDVPASKSARLPCKHTMCHSCLKRIFKMSVKDPAHMPPKCCTEKGIDLKHVEKLFNMDFKKLWNRKFKEYATKNRSYCPRPGCGEWIQPKHMTQDQGRKVGKCPKCKTLVCAICNQKAHKSRDCPQDPATIQLAKLAEEKGWTKCWNCSRMVELKEGCNHMTCWCRAEFCMTCGLKWKTCDCAWFNYPREADGGNALGYQQEMDRRREQEAQDEEYARRLAGGGRHAQGPGANGARNVDPYLLQQARNAFTANYQAAGAAAQNLYNGWFAGR